MAFPFLINDSDQASRRWRAEGEDGNAFPFLNPNSDSDACPRGGGDAFPIPYFPLPCSGTAVASAGPAGAQGL